MNEHSKFRAFDPQRMARYETENWVAYYRKQWLKLLRVSVGMVREGFGLALPHAVYGALLVGRAEFAAAPADNDIPKAEALMRRFYQLVKDVNHETYDVDLVARLEVNWWAVHRRLFGQTENAPLVQALTDLYAAVYQVAPELVALAAYHRAQAMVHSDRWVREGRIPRSPLIPEVEEELCKSYTTLLAAASGSSAPTAAEQGRATAPYAGTAYAGTAVTVSEK